jgi:hypothetical protein
MNDAMRIRTERQLDDIIAQANLLRIRLAIAAQGVPDYWDDTTLRDRERELALQADITAARFKATGKG